MISSTYWIITVKNVKDLAVLDHLLQCNCTIDFDHFDISATEVIKSFIERELLY